MTRKKPKRIGTAIVELAVCLPVIFFIVFASIEACNMIALKQILSESAYDGALRALRPDGEESEIIAGIYTVLAARNVTACNVIVAGSGGEPYNSLDHGDSVTVTVEAFTDGNMVVPQVFGFAESLSSTATGIKQ